MVQTFTLPQFTQYLNQLPKKFDKHSGEINNEMARALHRRIVLRVNPTSFFSTGNLKKNIKVEAKGKTARITAPYYWKFMNLGIGPSVPIPVEFLEQHLTNPNQPGKRVANPKWVNTPDNPMNWKGSKGFVDNAIISFDKAIPQIIERGLNKALQK